MATFPRDLNAPDATELLKGLRNGEFSSEQLVKQHLDRLNETQDALNGATQIFDEQAVAEARQLDASGDKTLPLFGLPCSIKETFGIAGEQVTAGSIRMTPERHETNSVIVQRLKDAGAVVIARSNIPEFAMTGETTNLRFGRTNNPLDSTRVAGGSSGGEGALIGSGASVFGVGSDILGSIRIPAAFCGVVGFKPHSGGVSTTGTWPEVTGNSKAWLALGPLTRSVRDAQLVYNVIANEPIPDAALSGRLVVPKRFPLRFQQSNIATALQVARQALLDEKMPMVEEDFSDIPHLYQQIPKLILDDFNDDWYRMLSSPEYGQFSVLKELLAQLRGKPTMDAGMFKWLLIGLVLKPRSAKKAQAISERFATARARYQAMLGDDGIMVMPTMGLVAPKHGEMNRRSMTVGVNGLFTAHTMGNYLDLSAIAIPAWKFCDPKTGLPPSISVLCAPGAEARLFAAAKRVERALNDEGAS